MRASDFEFRYRFWFILLIFLLSFLGYAFDHANVVMAAIKRLFPNDPRIESATARHAAQTLFVLSAALTAAGAGMRTWGSAYLRMEVVFDSVVRTEKLVANGPFRYVRNPLYFGNLLMFAGIGMLESRLGWLLLMLGRIFFALRLIRREEAVLTESQGERYRDYLAAVPRLFPSLTPRVAAGSTQPRWIQGFVGEGWMWFLALDGFIFACRLDLKLYYKFLWICTAAYFLRWLAMRWWRHRHPRPAIRSAASLPPS